jgi:hypothetical protein
MFERMTNPTPSDTAGVQGIGDYSRDQVKLIVDRILIAALETMQQQRDDFKVTVNTEDPSPGVRRWSVQIDLG